MLWNGTMKSEIEKIVENLRVNNIYKNSERGNNYEVEKVEWKKSVNWNHTNLILNWNKTFQLDSHWYESHQLKSTQSIQFDKHRINSWFRQYLYNRKYIGIAGTFSGTCFTSICLCECKWPYVTTTWLIGINHNTWSKS